MNDDNLLLRLIIGIIILISGLIYIIFVALGNYFYNSDIEIYIAVGIIVLGGILIFGDWALYWLTDIF